MGDIHQYIVYCLIPQDPWVGSDYPVLTSQTINTNYKPTHFLNPHNKNQDGGGGDFLHSPIYIFDHWEREDL